VMTSTLTIAAYARRCDERAEAARGVLLRVRPAAPSPARNPASVERLRAPAGVVELVDERVTQIPDSGRKFVLPAGVSCPIVDDGEEQLLLRGGQLGWARGANVQERVAGRSRRVEVAHPLDERVATRPRDRGSRAPSCDENPVETLRHDRKSTRGHA
jgi:hypothetical protein